MTWFCVTPLLAEDCFVSRNDVGLVRFPEMSVSSTSVPVVPLSAASPHYVPGFTLLSGLDTTDSAAK